MPDDQVVAALVNEKPFQRDRVVHFQTCATTADETDEYNRIYSELCRPIMMSERIEIDFGSFGRRTPRP